MFPRTSTQSCGVASSAGLFSGWRKGEIAVDFGEDLDDNAGDVAYFDGAPEGAICGETFEEARRLRRVSSFSTCSASTCTWQLRVFNHPGSQF